MNRLTKKRAAAVFDTSAHTAQVQTGFNIVDGVDNGAAAIAAG